MSNIFIWSEAELKRLEEAEAEGLLDRWDSKEGWEQLYYRLGKSFGGSSGLTPEFVYKVAWGLSYMKDGANGFRIVMAVNSNKTRYRVKFLFSRKFMPEIYGSLSRPYEHQAESIIKQDLIYELESVLDRHISKEHIGELVKQVPFSIRWA